MKKTLKLLMAIVLFAVVLMIATSVNAAEVVYDTLDKAVAEEADAAAADSTYKPLVEKKDGYYVFNKGTDTLKITETIDANNMKLVINNALAANIVVKGTTTVKTDEATLPTVTGTVQVNEGATLIAPEEFGTSMLNKGTMYIAEDATALTTAITNEGTIYTDADATALTTSVQLTLKDKVKVDGVDYTKVTVEKKDLDKKMTYTVAKIVPENEVAPATKIEAGKTYTLTVKAELDGKEVTAPATILAKPLNRDAKMNCEINGNNIEVVAAKDLEGDTIALAAQLTGVDESKKDLALISLGEIKEDEPTTDPTAEPTTEPTVAPTTDPNGEKDDTPKTGDTIIPATAVLAVVVVANVVYFARSKRS